MNRQGESLYAQIGVVADNLAVIDRSKREARQRCDQLRKELELIQRETATVEAEIQDERGGVEAAHARLAVLLALRQALEARPKAGTSFTGCKRAVMRRGRP